MGVAIGYIYKLTGKDYYLVKGLGVTGVSYLASMGFIVPLTKSAPQMRNSPSSLVGHIIAYTVFALITSLVIERYLKLVPNNKSK